MEPLVTAPSPWLQMQGSMKTLRTALLGIHFFTAVLFALVFIAVIQGHLDFGLLFTFLFTLSVGVALHEVHEFCEAATERIRQLSQLA